MFDNCGKKIAGNFSTFVELLCHRSVTQSDVQAFTFLVDGENVKASLTYQQLDSRARAIAFQLQAKGATGDRALLLYPPGLDYLAAFFGCLYAGVVAVPAYPPRNQRNTPRIKAIVADAQAQIALTTTAICSTVQLLIDSNSLEWLTTDNLEPGIEDAWQQPCIDTNTLAFLQYTSGSTGTPKGVMLTHGNLLHNAAATYQVMEHSPASRFVSWLPTYHDMGLIGGILQPVYGGFPCILLPPASFLQRPYRWLQTISHYKGTTSGAPNFAYELCTQKITPEQKQTLDLSGWSVAFNGAEPIRSDTLERFATAFADCGFRPEAFYPCYGMAEATLIVAGGQKSAPPVVKTVQKSALEVNQIIAAKDECHLVSCGQSIPTQQIIIANPDTLTRCQAGEVGEIWVSGASVGQGYWQRPTETLETFHACLSGTGEGGFLRTGDLGFLDDRQLFVTGRLKDLIIIRGRNLYPQDIELTAERCHSALRLGSNAAFTIASNSEERLVVVQELEFRAKPNLDEVASAIRQAVTVEHEIQVYAVVLIKGGTIPKTSSGKIQRRATRADFDNGQLEIVHSSIQENIVVSEASILKRDRLLTLTPAERQPVLTSYLIAQVARVLAVLPTAIEQEQPLNRLGLDSLKVFELKNQIEHDLEITVAVADLFESAIAQLAIKLSDLTVDTALNLTQIKTDNQFHPLSFAQQQLWFVHQLAPESSAYNIPLVVDFKGRLNVGLLEQSLKEIISCHAVLRTNFIVVGDRPMQVINPTATIDLPVLDLRELSDSERAEMVQKQTTNLAQQPFNLSTQLLIRGLLLRLAEEEYKLLLTLHHTVADGWSVGILMRELIERYGSLKSSSELPLQYVDFAYWQRQYLQADSKLLAYWRQQLGGNLPISNLPMRSRPPVPTFAGARTSLTIPKDLTQALKHLSQQEGATLYMILLAAFKTLLYRYTGQTDILVGSPVANRNHTEIDSLIGCFVNVLVLRSHLSNELSFKQLLAQIKSTALAAYEHQDLPFEQLVQQLQPERSLSYNPLFQVMFVFQNMPMATPMLAEMSIDWQEGYTSTSKFDLTLFMHEQGQELVATIEYNTDLFDAEAIARMLGHLETLLGGIVANCDRTIAKLPLLTAAEQHQMLVEWNNTQQDYPQDCIHQLFEQQVQRTPEAVALVFGQQRLTYRQLNNQANQLAHYLQTLGVKPEVIVGICVERSIEMIVGLLAILKVGGAYLPLDPKYPQERLNFMLANSQAQILVTQKHLVELFSNVRTVCFEDIEVKRQSIENLDSEVTAKNLAYAIYTSGSTGIPKGVAIAHSSCVALLTWARTVFSDDELKGVLASTSICFDLSLFEIFVPLSWGGKVILVENALHLSSATDEVTLINTVPSIISELLNGNMPTSVRTINLAGEPLSYQLAQQIYQNQAIEKVFNLYGPSEDTTYSTFTLVRKDDKIVSIGRPINNTQIYLLDSCLQPVPIGVTGEIYIGGAGLARNYLYSPEVTKEKFVINPFSNELKSWLYKTGDIARYLPNGNLEYLGRIDNQVKVRGFRIELGEVENVLSEHPAVSKVIVLAVEQQLLAYFVPCQDSTPTTEELRSYLKQLLPDFMIPAAFVLVNSMPLLLNGKVDRSALSRIKINQTKAYEAPQSEIEEAIAKIWREVLQLENVSVNDNFFDMGGHSLLMVRVQQKLGSVLEQKVGIIDLFQYPTIRSLAQYLSRDEPKDLVWRSLKERTQKQMDAAKKRKQLARRFAEL
ncbi:non-ribosomal peptide synthetase [Chlorogloea sp. CCALA 695]|uniref:non-ribosomal peptide synthetase n=1 Tax=Chlorogloea sp. CCALA 695 TaxID=2107693 RepID=UPI000D07B316|nr:non-ribosomal peptide synthetase [Chlorogloea sp. CCALA 695]PSB30548.1 non-ribosomal peptide synthetase [Chlorogloea sp. CCALA 695]